MRGAVRRGRRDLSRGRDVSIGQRVRLLYWMQLHEHERVPVGRESAVLVAPAAQPSRPVSPRLAVVAETSCVKRSTPSL